MKWNMEIIQQVRPTESLMIAINMKDFRQDPSKKLMYGNLNILQTVWKLSSVKVNSVLSVAYPSCCTLKKKEKKSYKRNKEKKNKNKINIVQVKFLSYHN